MLDATFFKKDARKEDSAYHLSFLLSNIISLSLLNSDSLSSFNYLSEIKLHHKFPTKSINQSSPAPPPPRVSFKDFVMYSKWWSAKKQFSQIWLHNTYENRKKQNPSVFLGFLLKVIIRRWRFGNFFLQNLANLDQSSHEKSFV